MFPAERDEAERQFRNVREFRVCYEIDKQPICRRLRLWCDGFIPERYLLDSEPGRITESPGSDLLGHHVKKSGIFRSSCLSSYRAEQT
jgi:hypothetical protein